MGDQGLKKSLQTHWYLVDYRKPVPRQKTTKHPSFQTMEKYVKKHTGPLIYFLDILNTFSKSNGSKRQETN
jgi:hypothetical protein